MTKMKLDKLKIGEMISPAEGIITFNRNHSKVMIAAVSGIVNRRTQWAQFPDGKGNLYEVNIHCMRDDETIVSRALALAEKVKKSQSLEKVKDDTSIMISLRYAYSNELQRDGSKKSGKTISRFFVSPVYAHINFGGFTWVLSGSVRFNNPDYDEATKVSPSQTLASNIVDLSGMYSSAQSELSRQKKTIKDLQTLVASLRDQLVSLQTKSVS
jgi:hypothetical protein